MTNKDYFYQAEQREGLFITKTIFCTKTSIKEREMKHSTTVFLFWDDMILTLRTKTILSVIVKTVNMKRDNWHFIIDRSQVLQPTKLDVNRTLSHSLNI